MISIRPGPRSARTVRQGPRQVPLCVSKDLKGPAHADGEDPDRTVQTHTPVQVPLTHMLCMRAQAHPSVDSMYKHFQRVREKRKKEHYCRTCFSMGDLGVQVSVRLFVRPCVRVCPSVCLSVRQHLPWVSCERNSSYSFLLIFLKLCRCFLHGVRMCMWFGYNCWIIFYHFFHFVNLVIFRPQCIDSGYLVSAILIQFYTNLFETLHTFSPWSENVHMVWI